VNAFSILKPEIRVFRLIYVIHNADTAWIDGQWAHQSLVQHIHISWQRANNKFVSAASTWILQPFLANPLCRVF
jgi:hypothetical protein